jgi:hypothetical protein
MENSSALCLVSRLLLMIVKNCKLQKDFQDPGTAPQDFGDFSRTPTRPVVSLLAKLN